jgi:hypothetical protein
MLRTLLAVAVTASLIGCFSPDYGDTPFFCTTTDTVCPDGYSCAVEQIGPYPANPERHLCVKDSAGGDNTHKCSDADLERTPNDTSQTATSLDDQLKASAQVSIYGLEICTLEDIDFYSFSLPAAKTVAVTVQYKRTSGILSAVILDSSLAEVAPATAESNGLRLEAKLGAGLYYLKIAAGADGSTNLYDLALNLSAP